MSEVIDGLIALAHSRIVVVRARLIRGRLFGDLCKVMW